MDIAAALNAALAAHRTGQTEEALRLYDAVLSADPDQPDALNLSASLLRTGGDLAQALARAARAALLAPDRADIGYNHGNALMAAGDDAGAAAEFARVVAHSDADATRADAAAHLGIVRARMGEPEAAVAAYEQALALQPAHAIAGLNLGNLLGTLGRADVAIARLRQAVADHPDLAEAHYNLGLALIRQGDWAAGAGEYEWRWRVPGFASPPRHTDIAAWDGRPFPGHELVIHAEQGLGDTLQFMRLVRLAASYGGSVVLEVPTVLRRLLAGLDLGDWRERVRITDEIGPATLPRLQCPLLSLPLRMGLSLGAMASPPYLKADAARVALWRDRLGLAADRRPVVALGWRGNPSSPADQGRSIADPALLAPLVAAAEARGLRLIAVQKLTADEMEADGDGWRLRGAPFRLAHPGPDFDAGTDAFLDTTAVMTLADRVITTDTSLLHLAGALGRPVTGLLKHVPDWRWGNRGARTGWYETMTLIRQPVPGDFASVIARAAAGLG